MRAVFAFTVVLTAIPTFAPLPVARAAESGRPTRTVPAGRARPAPVAPLHFEQNRGQTAPQVDYLARCEGYVAFLTRGAATFRTDGAAFRMRFVGASETARVRGVEPASGRSNYFIGNDPSKWVTDIPHFGQVAYEQVLPGVDVVYRGEGRALTYDVVVAPGADPANVRLRFEGVDALAVDGAGAVVLAIPGGRTTMSAPHAYQDVDGRRRAVAASFAVRADGSVGFDVGRYDASRRLVIDPSFTVSTYLGGTGGARAGSVAVDSSDHVYASGWTAPANFPVTTGAYQTTPPSANTGNSVAFVTKFAPSAAYLIYSTFVSGSYGGDFGAGIAVDASGNAYVGGQAQSTDFPLVNAYRTNGAGFVLKLSPSGSSLVWSTYVALRLARIRLDASNDVHGLVSFNSSGNINNSHVMKIASSGPGLVYDTDLTAGKALILNDIAVDSSGVLWAVGSNATSGQATSGALQSTFGGGTTDAWIARFDSSGAVDYKTYLGGAGADVATSVAFDAWGDVFVAGSTSSTDFPTSHAAQASFGGGNSDLWAARLDPSAKSLVWSTYLGGTSSEGCGAAALSRIDELCIVGSTYVSGFPTSNPVQSAYGGGTQDGVVAELSSDGSIVQSSYLGGSGYDLPTDVRFDGAGLPVVWGWTGSTDFPTTSGALQTTFPTAYPNSSAFLSVFPSSGASYTDVSPVILPTVTVGATCSVQLTAPGGAAPLSWNVYSSTLIPGLSLSTPGLLSGTPSSAGTYTFVARVVDAGGAPAIRHCRMTVNPPPTIGTSTLPDWTVGRPYATTLVANGGSPPLAWSLKSGALPAGATVSSTGAVEATALAEVGVFSFVVHVADVWGVGADRAVTLTVNPLPLVTTAPTLAPCTELRPFLSTLAAEGGTPPYVWSDISGARPTESHVDSRTGQLGGTLLGKGDYTFTVRVTDFAGASAERELSIHVNPSPRITSPEIPWAAVDRPYSFTFTGSGGTPSLLWSVSGGELPAGMSLDPDSGVLAGTPTKADRREIILRYRDSCGAFEDLTLSRPVADFVDLSRRGRFAQSLAFTLESSTAPTTSYLELLGGTELSISVARRGKGALPIIVSLHDDAQTALRLSPFASSKKGRFVLKRFPVPTTGRYFLRLTPTAPFKARISVSIQAKAPTKWADTATVGPPAGPFTIRFSALPGARLGATVKAVRGSGASPEITSLKSESGEELLVSGERKTTRGRVAWKAHAPLAGGDYTLTIDARDGTSGDVAWAVALKSPKQYAFELPELAVDGDD